MRRNKHQSRRQVRNRKLVAEEDLQWLSIECFRACTQGLRANTAVFPMVCVPACSVNRTTAHTGGNRKAETSNDLAKVANCRLHRSDGHITSRSNCEQCFATPGTFRFNTIISHPQLCRCRIATSIGKYIKRNCMYRTIILQRFYEQCNVLIKNEWTNKK